MRELVAYQLTRLAAESTELDPNVVIPAALTLIGVLGAAWIANRVSRSRRTPTTTTEPPTVPPSPLAAFSGTQNEFMALVIEDNALIRQEVAELRDKVIGLEEQLRTERTDRSHFERAVRRYLELLASVWPGPDPMPWPANGDDLLLADTLPRRARRPKQN